MKPLLTLTLALISFAALSQSKVSWGEEFKMHRSSTDLSIVYTDKSGIYMEESHDIMKVGFFSSRLRKSSILVKLDANMAEQYRNDFDKELKGKDFDRLFLIRDRLYLFATDFNKKDNSLHLYAAEIDKGSGNLKGDWQEIYVMEAATKKLLKDKIQWTKFGGQGRSSYWRFARNWRGDYQAAGSRWGKRGVYLREGN